jgi:diaminohydroxyphosphoribosylaminopyrimidine deaminase/5-amino-6-(5-phosphoribosylamino)uracil reductase
MVINDKNFFMGLALQEAWKYQGLTYPNPAVGCSIVSSDGRLLSVGAHKKAGKPHAEIVALQAAFYTLTQDSEILALEESADIHNYLLNNHNNIFHDTELFTTLEPCSHQGKTPSCAGLIAALGIKKVSVGSIDTNPVAKCGNKILQDAHCSVDVGVLQEECDALLEPFLRFREQGFVFFKWAQRLNGTIDGGVISSLDSRKHVHSLRSHCDLLVIGGESVRRDRPTLDARLVGGKAPDILILSREKEFDRTIPLFEVPKRKVFIKRELSLIQEYKNIMIEGGPSMFELIKEQVSHYLCYIAPSFGGSRVFGKEDESFEILNLQKEREDIIIWMKRKRGNK